MFERALPAISVGLYAFASLLALLALFSRRQRWHAAVLPVLVAATLPLAGLLALHAMRIAYFPVFGRLDAVAFYVLIMTLAYLRIAFQNRMLGVAAILAPYLTAMLLWAMPAIGAEPAHSLQPAGIWLGLHACTAFVAYGLFSLAGLLALLYLAQDQNLKRKRVGPFFQKLPALEALDRHMSRQVGQAFLALTISIVFGFVLTRHGGMTDVRLTDHGIAATLVTWGLYGILVHMRASTGRHGKGVAVVTVLGFCCVLLIFILFYAVAASAHGPLSPSLGSY